MIFELLQEYYIRKGLFILSVKNEGYEKIRDIKKKTELLMTSADIVTLQKTIHSVKNIPGIFLEIGGFKGMVRREE